MALNKKANNVRLPPEVNRILYVKNLPYRITAEEMYDIFGKYGAIRQIRVPIVIELWQRFTVTDCSERKLFCHQVHSGTTTETKGTAYVVYEDIFDAKNACDHLSGFNVCNRYLVVLYYQPNKQYKKTDVDKKRDELNDVKQKYGLNTPDHKQ